VGVLGGSRAEPGVARAEGRAACRSSRRRSLQSLRRTR